jgi:hypothetical protein
MPEHSARRPFGEVTVGQPTAGRAIAGTGGGRAVCGGISEKPGVRKRVTARGMARAVTDTTFGGKGEDRSVAGGVISYGVDSILPVPQQHNRSKRIHLRVHWGPIARWPENPRDTSRARVPGCAFSGRWRRMRVVSCWGFRTVVSGRQPCLSRRANAPTASRPIPSRPPRNRQRHGATNEPSAAFRPQHIDAGEQ